MRPTVAFLFSLLLTLGSANAMQMTGTIYKSNANENVVFDFAIKSGSTQYEVKGSTSTDKGIYHSTLNYGYITVVKSTKTPDGREIEAQFNNSGKLHVYPRERRAENLTLAAIPITGSFLQGYVDDGISFEGLTVAGTPANGCLDYNFVNGHYNAKDECSFGSCKISSSESGDCAFDYDDFSVLRQNSMDIQMRFSDFKVTGRINFNDEKVKNRSSDGDVDVEVTATLGTINADIIRTNGSEIVLSPANVTDTDDDFTVTKLIAFFELMAFDMFSE